MKRVFSIVRLILMAPPYVTPVNGKEKVAYDINGETIRDEIRSIVKSVAVEKNIEFLDLFEITENHPKYYDDGVHPNKLGNEVIEKAVYKMLTT